MNKANRKLSVAARMLIGVLVVVYFFALFSNIIHSYNAHQEIAEEVCLLEEETDACHRAIYHHDKEHGCNHKSHLIIPVVDCSQCAIAIMNHLPEKQIVSVSKVANHVPIVAFYIAQDYINSYVSGNSLRGPPTIS
ncbi:MAG: hypothetical protein ABFS32_14795 [Bacteroidota bacterium]